MVKLKYNILDTLVWFSSDDRCLQLQVSRDQVNNLQAYSILHDESDYIRGI